MNLNQVLNSTSFKPNIRMFKVYYKTAPCRFGTNCKYADICFHYHTENEKRYPTCMSFYTDNGDCCSPDYCIRGLTHEKKLPRMPQELHDSIKMKLEDAGFMPSNSNNNTSSSNSNPTSIPDKYHHLVDKACKQACKNTSNRDREEFRTRERKNEKYIEELKNDVRRLEDDNYDLKEQVKKRKFEQTNDKNEIENLKRLNNYLIQQLQYNSNIPRPPHPSSFN